MIFSFSLIYSLPIRGPYIPAFCHGIHSAPKNILFAPAGHGQATCFGQWNVIRKECIPYLLGSFKSHGDFPSATRMACSRLGAGSPSLWAQNKDTWIRVTPAGA